VIAGRVESFRPFSLVLNRGPHIDLHNGTVIRPTGLNLHRGQYVRVEGHRLANGDFSADRIVLIERPERFEE